MINPKLELLITELAERLQNYSGKKVYGYLPPATKRIVDAIVDELASDERVAEAYSLWHDMRDEVFSFIRKQNRSVCRCRNRRSSSQCVIWSSVRSYR